MSRARFLHRDRPLARTTALTLMLVAATAAARADDGIDPFDGLPAEQLAAEVAALSPPPLSALQSGDPKATWVVLATRLDTSRAAVGDAIRPAEVPLVRPTPKVPTSTAARPIPVERAAITAPASRVRIVDDQSIEVHADGLPSPNAPSRDPLERVLPRAVDPASVLVGARWGAQDRLTPAPTLPTIAISAQADLFPGPPAERANAVRRSLRLTALWNQLDDLRFGLTPGVQRGGGNFLQHYVAGLQASTLDPRRDARWRSWIEVSGEKLAPNNIYANSSAQLRAGASWQASSATQLDLSVSRGTMDKPDTQSSASLSMQF